MQTRKIWTWPPTKHASFMYLWLCLFKKNSAVVYTYWEHCIDESNILLVSVWYKVGLVDDTTYSGYQTLSEMSLQVFCNCKSIVALKWLWRLLTCNDYLGGAISTLMQFIQAAGLLMEEILGMHNRSVVALVQWRCIIHSNPTPSVLFLSVLSYFNTAVLSLGANIYTALVHVFNIHCLF
jgi:hypothetical protein